MAQARGWLTWIAASVVLAGPGTAETLGWASSGDALTLDPHAQNEGPTITMNKRIMEPLVDRDSAGELIPSLASSWSVSEDDPSIWVFDLREEVTFHDGAAFTAEDVVFSLDRARSESSNFRELLSDVVDVRAPDSQTVEIETRGPNPLLPNNLTNILVMDQGWAEEHDAVEVQDYAAGETTYAASNANGTGPYRLVSREADVRTVLEMYPEYWGVDQFPLDVTRIEYTPIQNAATRVAALLSGEVDFIQNVPVQDLQRIDGTDGLKVLAAPENRTIFFGLNVGQDDLASDNIEGENPLADPAVREAMDLAINRQAIQQVVMRGQSEPAGIIAPPFVDGYEEAFDTPETDIDRARGLMEEAGYGDGFSIRLDCPNNRYVNDEAICQAVVGMMSQIGIDVALSARPRAQHFPLITGFTGDETDFFMLGWGVPTFDSAYIFNFLVHSRNETYGSWNATGYSNPDLDARIESLGTQTDQEARTAALHEIWQVVQDERIYLPVHHQVLNWAMTDGVMAAVAPDDSPRFKTFELN